MFQLPNDSDWGIDTVSCWFNVDAGLCDQDSQFWTEIGSRSRKNQQGTRSSETYKGFLQKDYGQVTVQLFLDTDICRLEFNAARMVSPKSSKLLPPNALKPLVEAIVDDLQGTVWAAFDVVMPDGSIVRDSKWASQVRLTRLDAARNFVIPEPEILKNALRQVRSKHQKTKGEMETKGAWTITNRTQTSGVDNFYDKQTELKNDGVDEEFSIDGKLFRFEAQLRKDRLQTLGLNTLARVDEESIWNAVVSRWSATNWGVSVSSSNDVRAVLKSHSPTLMCTDIGYLYLCEKDLSSELPPNFRSARDKRLRKLGITPGTPLDLVGVPDSFLDIHSGSVTPLIAKP